MSKKQPEQIYNEPKQSAISKKQPTKTKKQSEMI